MRHAMKWAATACAAVCAWLTQRLGGWDAALGMLFLLMGLDVLAGLLKGFRGLSPHTPGGRLASRTLFQGLCRKLMMLVLVAVATAVDGALGDTGISRLSVISFYTANEALSIVENAAVLGVPFPGRLLKALEAMREKEDQTPPPAPEA